MATITPQNPYRKTCTIKTCRNLPQNLPQPAANLPQICRKPAKSAANLPQTCRKPAANLSDQCCIKEKSTKTRVLTNPRFQLIKKIYLKTCREPAANLPQTCRKPAATCRKPAANPPQTCRKPAANPAANPPQHLSD